MFRVQVRILRRALALVKVGGRVVYSTCSMNPIENEAVVCAVLASSNGSVKIAEAKINGVELASTGLKVCFVVFTLVLERVRYFALINV